PRMRRCSIVPPVCYSLASPFRLVPNQLLLSLGREMRPVDGDRQLVQRAREADRTWESSSDIGVSGSAPTSKFSSHWGTSPVNQRMLFRSTRFHRNHWQALDCAGGTGAQYHVMQGVGRVAQRTISSTAVGAMFSKSFIQRARWSGFSASAKQERKVGPRERA